MTPRSAASKIRTVALRITVTTNQADDPHARSFRYEFDGDRTQILLGRQGGVDVLLPSEEVALVHGRIERRGEDYFLVDGGSPGGTRLNGRAVLALERAPLRDRDRVTIGPFALQIEIVRALTADSSFNETSVAMARRMVRTVFDRIGSEGRAPSLTVLDGPDEGQVLRLVERERTYLLGLAGRRMVLDAVDAWQEHVALVRDEAGVTVRLLGPSTLVRVGAEAVAGERLLHDGDHLFLAGHTLVFADPAEEYLSQLSASPVATEVPDAGAVIGQRSAGPTPTGRQGISWSSVMGWGVATVGGVALAAAALGLWWLWSVVR